MGATDYRLQALANADLVDPDYLDAISLWWGGLFISGFTLFLSLTGGVNWWDVARFLPSLGPIYFAVFLVYITFAFFTVLNVVTGVFCQKAIEYAQRDEEDMVAQVEVHKKDYADQLRRIFSRIDVDSDGWITRDDFMQIRDDDEVKLIFEALDIHINDAKVLFGLLDGDHNGLVDVDELLLGCMKVKGTARGIDMYKLLQMNRKIYNEVQCMKRKLEVQSLNRGHHLSESLDDETDEEAEVMPILKMKL